MANRRQVSTRWPSSSPTKNRFAQNRNRGVVIDFSVFSYKINSMIVDTHSHLQFDAYDGDRDEVIKRTRAEGIACINVGCSFTSSKAAVEMAEKQEGFYAAIGLHPIDVDEEFDKEKYKNLALSGSRKVVAIGEIGLDYFRPPFDEKKQQEIFLQQVVLAQELDLPVIIHCRKAHDQMLELLKGRNLRGVIHCFTGTLSEAEKYIALGFYLGMNGIMFKFPLEEVVKNIGLEHMLLETDSPYLTPPMAPQKRNEPVFIKYTIQKIAELKNVSIQEIEAVTTKNAKKLFNI